MTDAIAQQGELTGWTRQIAEGARPGSTFGWSNYDHVPTQDGFFVDARPGLTLVTSDVTDAQPGDWSLQISSSMGFDAPVDMDIATWVNARNRAALVGKYYYVVAQEQGVCAVIWETLIQSRLLTDLFTPAGFSTLQWVSQVVDAAVHYASVESQGFVQRFGGRTLGVNDRDFAMLFTASSG